MAPHTPPTAACDGRSQFLRSWEFLMPALPAFFMAASLRIYTGCLAFTGDYRSAFWI
jgi:hypothetical protein